MEELNLDQDFLMRFSCMGTQDKDVLISELHGILDSQLSREGCAFFLDMTNWNLQAAVGAFYDHYSNESGVLPEMTLVERKTVAGQNVASLTLPANTVFTETWTLRNTGTMPWPMGAHLALKTGEEISANMQSVRLPILPPGRDTSLTLEFHAPSAPGVYHSQWRACTSGGALFGDPVWVIVRVQEDASVMGLANQLSTISTQETDMEQSDSQAGRQPQTTNPFGTPTFQDHSFRTSSLNSSTGTGTCLERLLLQNHPPSPVLPDLDSISQGIATENTLIAGTVDPVRTSADSTTSSFPIPSLPVSSQNQTSEWNTVTSNLAQQTVLSAQQGAISQISTVQTQASGDTVMEDSDSNQT